MKTPLSTPLDRKLLSTTAERIKLLKEIEIETVGDLLQYFPRDHEDFSHPTNLSELRADEKNLLVGQFQKVWIERVRGNMQLTKASFEEEQGGGVVECVWFRNPSIKTRLPLYKRVRISAKAKIGYGRISLQSPAFELFEDGVHLGGITPIYREHGALSSSWFRDKIHALLEGVTFFSDILPEQLQDKEGLLSRHDAICEMHFPTNEDRLLLAKKTLGFEELFLLQLRALLKKKEWEDASDGNGLSIFLDPKLIQKFFATLPFTPTNAQKIAIFEILKDLEKTVPMLRLLEGDVGSGKTIVAVAAVIPVIKGGGQAAFLAPTEILAQQHFQGVKKLLHDFDPNIRVELLTGSITGKARKEILEQVRYGKIHVLIGTHALLEDSVLFSRLAFVMIDEQHRFGVDQRQRLIEKGAPHVLHMTATPIPRTLALVAFGDQDLSVLNEMPPGRKKIHTKVVPPSERQKIERFIELEIGKGRQVFVICPLVEESEKLEVKSTLEEFARLERDFPKLKIGLLHGKMKGKEKEEIMSDFKEKKYDLLVATSVVEVGVDVPNATIMMIEGAERFGLAQLHQFRGRVGRSEYQSYCFLFSTSGNITPRLRAMEQEHCGFALAEIDLEIRGMGELYGKKQSGLSNVRIASFSDGRLLQKARQEAEAFLEEFSVEDFPVLKKALKRLE